MGLGGLVLGSVVFYLKGMRRVMFQLSGFYSNNILSDCSGASRQSGTYLANYPVPKRATQMIVLLTLMVLVLMKL